METNSQYRKCHGLREADIRSSCHLVLRRLWGGPASPGSCSTLLIAIFAALSMLALEFVSKRVIVSTMVSPFKRLVVLMMENRSFDHMLGYLKASDYPVDGLDGDETNLS